MTGDGASRPPLAARLRRLGRLMRKELAEILRDRRTVGTLVLMPLLLYPLVAIGFQQYLLGRGDGGPATYRIGLPAGRAADFLMEYLRHGERVLEEEGAFRPPDAPAAAAPHQLPAAQLEFYAADHPEAELLTGRLDVLLLPRGPLPRTGRDLAIDCELVYREESALGLDVALYVRRLTDAANRAYLAARLRAAGGAQRPDPVRLTLQARRDPGPKAPAMLAALVPLVLILMTITGAVYPAIDLTAGERERGTLEVLVAAPIPRLGVLFAKYVAVLTVATLTAGVNLAAMTATLWATGMSAVLLAGQDVGVAVFAEVVALLLLFAAFFSAVLLALTSFARSFKEAQAYLIPLMLVSMVPGMVGLIPGVELTGVLAVVPLLNVVLLARDLIAGQAAPTTAVVVVLSTFLYALAALGLAARVFGAEAVLYSQSSGWGDLFRRPRTPRDAPEPSAALLTLALMFPLNFLLTFGQARLHEVPLGVSLIVATAANLLLFAALPALSLWRGRVRLVSALGLARPGVQACAAAVVLGLSLWPLIHALTLVMREAGLTTLSAEHLAKLREGLLRWRELPPAAVLVVLAVLVPVLEELFFRGYLFGALAAGTGPAAAVGATAALFGLFHLFLPFGLTLERIVPTGLMGLVLGWVRWRSGSVFPGVLLHVAHNAVLVLMGYYRPELEAGGWVTADERVPAVGLLAALGTSAAATLWLAAATRRRES